MQAHECPDAAPGHQAELLARIVELQFELAGGLDLESTLQLACDRLLDLTGADATFARLEGAEPVCHVASGRSTPRASVVSALLERSGEGIGTIEACSPCADAFDDRARDAVALVAVAVSAVLARASEPTGLDDFRTIFATAPIGIVRVNAGGGAVTANPALERMLGYSAAELAERGFEELPPEAGEPVPCRLFDELIQNAFDPWACDSYRVEKRLARKHGPPLWTQVTAKLARHRDGGPAYGLAMIEDISRRKEVEEALRRESERNEYQALHDPLTGLANRKLFHERIEQATLLAAPDEDSLAVLVMDVDRFKEINDSLGHQAGDAFLRELAARLGSVLRQSDTVARLGGDEFGVLLPDRHSLLELERVIARIVDAVEQPVVLEDIPLVVELSIGVARYPRDGEDVDTLLRRADVAMYAAKRTSASCVFYDAKADVHDRGRLTLVGELHRALEERELTLHFQPKATLATSDVHAVEALLRWQHPTRGLVLPDAFIPLAQDTSLMTPLTLYVVAEALRQAQEWEEHGLTLSIAVNLATRNLLDASFPEQVERLLAASGADPARLDMEITESAMLGDPARVDQVLARLSALGIRLSIDDFGTGYSSLSHLTRLPISEIKIDRSFVARMTRERDAAAIVRSVIELAKSLGLDVVAEGVESAEIWQRLGALGCAYAQGEFLSRPLAPQELRRWLAKRELRAAAAA